MDHQQLEKFITDHLPEAEIKAGKQFTEVIVPFGSFHDLAKHLINSEETLFDFYQRFR